jgi:hypothetical protein
MTDSDDPCDDCTGGDLGKWLNHKDKDNGPTKHET